jgi:hypothetical protein
VASPGLRSGPGQMKARTRGRGHFDAAFASGRSRDVFRIRSASARIA